MAFLSLFVYLLIYQYFSMLGTKPWAVCVCEAGAPPLSLPHEPWLLHFPPRLHREVLGVPLHGV